MVNFLAEDPLSPFALHHDIPPSRLGNGEQAPTGTSFWAPSLDPKNEERMPNEFRHWRRWSNHFDKDMDGQLLRFDM